MNAYSTNCWNAVRSACHEISETRQLTDAGLGLAPRAGVEPTTYRLGGRSAQNCTASHYNRPRKVTGRGWCVPLPVVARSRPVLWQNCGNPGVDQGFLDSLRRYCWVRPWKLRPSPFEVRRRNSMEHRPI